MATTNRPKPKLLTWPEDRPDGNCKYCLAPIAAGRQFCDAPNGSQNSRCKRKWQLDERIIYAKRLWRWENES
jgi:hypothetical protein